MERSIGAFEAKSQLSRLLRAVEHGEHFTIIVRGKPVADLVPHQHLSSHGVAESIEAMQALPLIRGVLDADMASFVAEGRR